MSELLQAQIGCRICTRGFQRLSLSGDEFQFAAGSICIISPIVPLQVIGQSDDFCTEEFIVPLPVIFPMLKTIAPIAARANIFLRPIVALTSERQQALLTYFRDIKRREELVAMTENKAERLLRQTALNLLKQLTFTEIIPAYVDFDKVEDESVNKLHSAIVPQFILSVNMNFREHRDVQFYANEAHMTANYFTRIFRQHTGFTPSQIITNAVCAASRSLLVDSSLSVKEIAAELGFPEQFTFRKYFKKHVGMSPTEFRQMNAGRER